MSGRGAWRRHTLGQSNLPGNLSPRPGPGRRAGCRSSMKEAMVMSVHVEGRRVLVAAADAGRAILCEVLSRTLLPAWEVVEADSVERARFLQQLDPCDVLLLDASLTPGDTSGLRWLTTSQQ